MDHVEYDLLVVSVRREPATLAGIFVGDPAGRELTRIDDAALAEMALPLSARTPP